MTLPNGIPQSTAEIAEEMISRNRLSRRISLFSLIVSAIATIGFILLGILTMSWQSYAVAGAFGLSAVYCGWVAFQFSGKDLQLPMVLLVSAIVLALIVFSAFTVNVNIPVGIFCILFGIIIASTSLSGNRANQAITIGLAGGTIASLIGAFSPFIQISFSFLLPFVLTALVLLIGLYLYMLIRRQIQTSLVIKLVSLVLAMALIPLILLSLIQAGFLQTAVQNQTTVALRLASEQVAAQVDSFFTSNLESVSQESSLPIFGQFLSIPPSQREGSASYAELTNVLSSLSSRTRVYAPSYGVLNRNGVNVYDTNPLLIGSNESTNTYFTEAISTGLAYSSSVEFSPLNNDPYIYFSAPIQNELQQTVGVLRVRYDAHILQSLISDYTGLIGQRSFPILLDENMIRLADTLTPNLVYRSLTPLSEEMITNLFSIRRLPDQDPSTLSSNLPAFATALQNSTTQPYFQAQFYPEDPAREELAYVTRLSTRPWYVVYTEEAATLQNLLLTQNRLSTVIASLFAGLVGIIGTIASTILTRPITDLNVTALKIAGGDLSAQAVITTRDEIGTLANTFNAMTGQLRELISGLEARVAERTQTLAEQNEALKLRSRQLQTVAEVARGVVSMQDLQSLLDTLVRLISDRFNFYHVGIFLLDSKNEFALLKAANSEGGQRMLARQHKLKIGQVGIVGYTAGRGEARIATDVGEDAVYFSNPDLPLTRSEMALPLQAGGRVIGVLDVQSTQPNAFTQEDIELFSTLADQVAIAIYNSQLYQSTLQALEDSQRLHRQYLKQEWAREIGQREQNSIHFSQQGITSEPPADLPEIQAVLQSGRNIILSSSDNNNQENSVMAIPIKLREETIGIIHLQDSSDHRLEWSDQEIEIVQSVADQVGLALENARLLEQTVRRADRERKVLEITGKIRATTDPQEMLQIAAEEMQRVLNATRTQIVVQPLLNEPLPPPKSEDESNANTG